MLLDDIIKCDVCKIPIYEFTTEKGYDKMNLHYSMVICRNCLTEFGVNNVRHLIGRARLPNE